MKIKNKAYFLGMALVILVQVLIACEGSSSSSVDDPKSGVSEDPAESPFGKFEVDGVEGDLTGKEVSFPESVLNNHVTIIEQAATADNVFNDKDCGIGFVAYTSRNDDLYISSIIRTYFSYEKNTVYSFFGEEVINGINYYISGKSQGLIIAEDVKVIFSKTANKVGEEVAGELEFVTTDGEILVMSFRSDLASYSTNLDCEDY